MTVDKSGTEPTDNRAQPPESVETMESKATTRSRLSAIIQRRCPRCLNGSIYERFFKPNPTCPECGIQFEREPGYYLGSFYISYGLGAVAGLPTILLVTYMKWSLEWLAPLVAAWVVIIGPFIVTYSRVLWYHLDQLADPR